MLSFYHATPIWILFSSCSSMLENNIQIQVDALSFIDFKWIRIFTVWISHIFFISEKNFHHWHGMYERKVEKSWHVFDICFYETKKNEIKSLKHDHDKMIIWFILWSIDLLKEERKSVGHSSIQKKVSTLDMNIGIILRFDNVTLSTSKVTLISLPFKFASFRAVKIPLSLSALATLHMAFFTFPFQWFYGRLDRFGQFKRAQPYQNDTDSIKMIIKQIQYSVSHKFSSKWICIKLNAKRHHHFLRFKFNLSI